MTRKIIGVDTGFVAFRRLRAERPEYDRYIFACVTDDVYDSASGAELTMPARALELIATPAQARQIAEAIIASLEAEVTS